MARVIPIGPSPPVFVIGSLKALQLRRLDAPIRHVQAGHPELRSQVEHIQALERDWKAKALQRPQIHRGTPPVRARSHNRQGRSLNGADASRGIVKLR